jgi:RNA polymerase sigma-70 factor (ECF subfamily)
LTPEELALVNDCMAEKRASQKLFFERYAPVMFSICRRYTSSREEAEDMLQEGFIRAFANLHQIKDGSLEGWLKRIFVNTCLNEWRRKKNKQWSDIETAALHLKDESEDGLQKMQAEELLLLINELPEGAKVVFNLYAVEGFSHAEIGQMLLINESTSRAQLARARMLLRSKIEIMNSK